MKAIIRFSLFFACLYAGLAVAGEGHDDGHAHDGEAPETEAFYGDESSGKDKSMDDHHENMDEHHRNGDGQAEEHHGSHDNSDENDDGHDHGGEHGHDH